MNRIMPNAVKTEFVDCPVCGQPDMRREEDAEGCALILCVNHACASNGGSNSDALAKSRGEEEALVEFRVRCDGILRKIILVTFGLCAVAVVVAYIWQQLR